MTQLKNKDAELNNPCLKEQEQSYKCLSKNGYDQEKCTIYFDNYNTCKKFWGQIYRDRKVKGITPYLPNIEDRSKIKDDFMKRIGNN